MALTDPSKRLEAIPPYMFAELERKVADKREAGIDVISLGIGDPGHADLSATSSRRCSEAVAENGNQKYPSNRGRAGVPQRARRLLRPPLRRRDRSRDRGDPGDRRQGVHLQPLLRLPRPRRRRPRLRSRLPRLHRRAGARRRRGRGPAAGSRARLRPGPRRDRSRQALRRARLLFLNYPNNPTGAIAPDGLFERVVELAREHEILVVHDNAYSETTYDGYVAPSFLQTPGRQGGRGRGLQPLEGLQHDRLALRRDPRQRRRDPDLLAPEDQRRLGPLRGGPARRRGGARGAGGAARGDERDLRPAPRPRRRRARARSASTSPLRRGRSTSGLRFPRATPRRRSASTCSSRPPS